jgi:hypothetical protein
VSSSRVATPTPPSLFSSQKTGETWDQAVAKAKSTASAMSSAGESTWDDYSRAAQDQWDAAKDKTAQTAAEARDAAWRTWLSAKSYAGGLPSWRDVQKQADGAWKDLKSGSTQTYDQFMQATYDQWSGARAAAGGTLEDYMRDAEAYWAATKGRTKAGYDEFMARSRQAYEEARRPGWWHRMTSAMGGAVDSAKDALRIGEPSVDRARREAHEDVDVLHKHAKKNVAAEF